MLFRSPSDANLIDGTVVGKGMADPDIKTEVVANLPDRPDQTGYRD